DDDLVAEVCEIVGGDSEEIAFEIVVIDSFREPAFGAKAITIIDGSAQFIDVAALISRELRRIENRRLAPRLPRLRRVDRALDQQIVPSIGELLANIPRRETRDQRVLRMLRGRIREHRESGDGEKEIVRRMLAT